MAEVVFGVSGLAEWQGTLQELGPSFARRVYPSALGAMASVVLRKARSKNYGFTDGIGDRTSAIARGKKSVRLRSTLRRRGITAYYSGQRYKRGRYAIIAGGAGARQSYLVEAGHGGPRPAKPHPYLTRALLETRAASYNAFVSRFRDRFVAAVLLARSRGASATGARILGRRIALRGRRR